MSEARLTCPSCAGRISTFDLETGRGSGVCCECTDSYDIVVRETGANHEVRTVDLSCRRTGKRSFHVDLERVTTWHTWLVFAGCAAMAALAVALVVVTGLAIAHVAARGLRAWDAPLLTAPVGLYLLAVLSRNLTLRERVSVCGSKLTWTRTIVLPARWTIDIDDVASTTVAADRGICLVLHDGSKRYIGAAVGADDAALRAVWQRLRGQLHRTSEIRLGRVATAGDATQPRLLLH